MRHLEEKFCKELSEKTNRDIELTRESWYIGEQNLHYRKLIVDGKVTKYHVDINNLREYSDRNKLSEKAKALTEILLNQGE